MMNEMEMKNFGIFFNSYFHTKSIIISNYQNVYEKRRDKEKK